MTYDRDNRSLFVPPSTQDHIQGILNAVVVFVMYGDYEVEEVPVMLSRLLEAHELIIGKLRVAIDKTAANQDTGTNDLLVSQVLRTNKTQVWFLAEHLVDTPLVCS